MHGLCVLLYPSGSQAAGAVTELWFESSQSSKTLLLQNFITCFLSAARPEAETLFPEQAGIRPQTRRPPLMFTGYSGYIYGSEKWHAFKLDVFVSIRLNWNDTTHYYKHSDLYHSKFVLLPVSHQETGSNRTYTDVFATVSVLTGCTFCSLG